MKANDTKVTARFALETRFAVSPVTAGLRAGQENELERLKKQLLGERLARVKQLGLTISLQRAANEAAALAWVTKFPLLVFPALFEEKARTVLLQAQRQAGVRERSRELLAA